jgi:hypothetical protein
MFAERREKEKIVTNRSLGRGASDPLRDYRAKYEKILRTRLEAEKKPSNGKARGRNIRTY